jgi:hypothetical protein
MTIGQRATAAVSRWHVNTDEARRPVRRNQRPDNSQHDHVGRQQDARRAELAVQVCAASSKNHAAKTAPCQ